MISIIVGFVVRLIIGGRVNDSGRLGLTRFRLRRRSAQIEPGFATLSCAIRTYAATAMASTTARDLRCKSRAIQESEGLPAVVGDMHDAPQPL